MKPRWLATVGALALLSGTGCSPSETRLTGIDTRIAVDRLEARVGDPVGITVEIETPVGFHVEPPAAPAESPLFLTERLTVAEPIGTSRRVHHALLWTVRPKAIGEHRLPDLLVPLVHPDGRIEPLPVVGLPLKVRSVRADLPGREAFFDIRRAPPPEAGSGWLIWLVAGIGLPLLVGGWALRRRQRTSMTEPTVDPRVLARESERRIAAALHEQSPRALAAGLAGALWSFIEGRWGVASDAATPDDLPEAVDSELATLLRAVHRARFERRPDRESLLDTALVASAFLRDVAER